MYDRQEPGANQDPEQLLLDHVNIHLPSTLQCEEIFTFSQKNICVDQGTPGEDYLHHGVGPGIKDEDETLYHQYYQWVPLFLTMQVNDNFFQNMVNCFKHIFSLQALFFYFPHWMWKQLEGGRFDCIMMGLNIADSDDKTSDDKKIDTLVNYMKERRLDEYEHKVWAAKFYFCELLNLINVIVQMRWTDRFKTTYK